MEFLRATAEKTMTEKISKQHVRGKLRMKEIQNQINRS
jgi:hypothetical protein